MSQRDKAGGKAITVRHRKTSTRPSAAVGNLKDQLDRRTRELNESREQQAATLEVLKVISSSPGDLARVFDAILERATRLCEATHGHVWRFDGEWLHVAAVRGDPQFVEWLHQHSTVRPAPGSAADRIVRGARFDHMADRREESAYRDNQTFRGLVDTGGIRASLCVAVRSDETLLGMINVYRQEIRPFTDKQIALVENFAAQAVIALENTRLLNELRQRTGDLSEALEQQTATSEVLKVIAGSSGELTPVFEAMLENAVRICDAKFGTMWLREGDEFRVVALHNAPSVYEERRRNRLFHPADLHPKSAFRRFLETRQVVHIADLRMDEGYLAGAPTTVDMVDAAGARTGLMVPMLKGNELVGSITIYRQEVRPFTDKQIELVQNFAAQAVIAIENTRLLNDLRQRTHELSEALEQQTATSEVLKVISSSPGELEPVFTAMLENATRICDAEFGTLYLRETDAFRAVAIHNAPPAYVQARKGNLVRPPPDSALGQVVSTRQVAQIDDAKEIKSYVEGNQYAVSAVELGGYRTIAAVPMLKDSELVGAILIYRQEVRRFSEKQIALLQNFATQAVIAIENARLLNDLNKLNQQLETRVADQVSEIERMGRLRRFLPPQVADLIVASGAEKQLESHRREITALFCDLRGFTGFSESSDPEDVMALLHDYHAAIGGIINKYGGTLERYAGDGVMVVFNDPIQVDNPALQAVLMAIEMRVAIGALIEKWRKLGHEIGFGIGIAHGFATLGTIGFEGRFDYAAIGIVSNVASRLCDEAKPGQILISPRVLMAVEKDVAVETVGDFALKGIRRPLTAYNVLAIKTAD